MPEAPRMYPRYTNQKPQPLYAKQAVPPKKESKFTLGMFALCLTAAVTVDLIQIGLDLVGIGAIINFIINAAVWFGFFIYFKLHEIDMISPKKAITFAGSAIADIVSVGALPAWTFAIIVMYVLEKHEKLLTTFIPGGKALQALDGFKGSKQNRGPIPALANKQRTGPAMSLTSSNVPTRQSQVEKNPNQTKQLAQRTGKMTQKVVSGGIKNTGKAAGWATKKTADIAGRGTKAVGNTAGKAISAVGGMFGPAGRVIGGAVGKSVQVASDVAGKTIQVTGKVAGTVIEKGAEYSGKIAGSATGKATEIATKKVVDKASDVANSKTERKDPYREEVENLEYPKNRQDQ